MMRIISAIVAFLAMFAVSFAAATLCAVFGVFAFATLYALETATRVYRR